MVSKPGDLWDLIPAAVTVNRLGAEGRKARGGIVVVLGEEDLPCGTSRS